MSALVTNVGRAKMAAALANDTAINISHIAIGSSDRYPTGGEDALESEVFRSAITERGLIDGQPNSAFFRTTIPETGEEPGANYGPWLGQEYGLIDDEGDLIVIGRLAAPQPKNDPDGGQPNAIALQIDVIFSDLEAINLSYTPAFNLPWATQPQADDRDQEQRAIDPKRLHGVLDGHKARSPHFFYGLM